jgi:hypothetical protein
VDGDIEVNDPSPVVTDDDQAVEQPELAVATTNMSTATVLLVVAQEAAPGRRGPGPQGLYCRRWLVTTMPSEQFAVWGTPEGWPRLFGGSEHGFLGTSWAVPDGRILISTANRNGSPCDAIDHRGRLDQTMAQGLWPNPIKPSVGRRRTVSESWALTPQDQQLVPKSDEPGSSEARPRSRKESRKPEPKEW